MCHLDNRCGVANQPVFGGQSHVRKQRSKVSREGIRRLSPFDDGDKSIVETLLLIDREGHLILDRVSSPAQQIRVGDDGTETLR
jgi:hypothetical protein